PTVLEYVDLLTMEAIRDQHGLDLGIPDDVRASTLAYLVLRLESTHADRLDDDVAALGALLVELGAADAYVLLPGAADQLIDAREKAFWLAKANGADDIVDVCVPRVAMPELMSRVAAVGTDTGSW